MNRGEFDLVVAATVTRTATLLVKKGAEYADDADRLANFKRNAEKNGQTVLETWQTYWGKHVDAINTYMARVKDNAMDLVIKDITDSGYMHGSRGVPVPYITAEEFKARLNLALPVAMKAIDAQLSEPIEGRFDDNINYSFLALAILQELRNP